MIPHPSGRFTVGTRILPPVIEAAVQDERFLTNHRSVVVQLWYPTNRHAGQRAPYVFDARLLDYLKSESEHPETIESWRGLASDAILDAPPDDGPFPLVIVSQGMGMPRFGYTAWVQELASRGYVVAALDHPGIAPVVVDGRLIPGEGMGGDPQVPARRVEQMASDFEAVRVKLLASATQLHIDSRYTAVVGHSLGGSAALEECRRSGDFGACIDIDGDVWGKVETAGVGRSFLVILNEPIPPVGERMAKERRDGWLAVAEKQKAEATVAIVTGTNHLSFTDAPFVNSRLLEGTNAVTDPAHVLRTTVTVIDAYLKSQFNKSVFDPPSGPNLLISPLRAWASGPPSGVK